MSRSRLATTRKGLKNYSGTHVIKAPLEKIVAVLSDSVTKGEWLGGLVEERELERGSESNISGIPSNFVVYQHYTLAPPLNDRDYVISGIWEFESTEGENGIKKATLDLQSVKRDDMLAIKGRVRAALNFQVFTLESLPNDEGTQVSVEVNVDPLGNMPVFIVNLYASTWCPKTLDALEKYVLSL